MPLTARLLVLALAAAGCSQAETEPDAAGGSASAADAGSAGVVDDGGPIETAEVFRACVVAALGDETLAHGIGIVDGQLVLAITVDVAGLPTDQGHPLFGCLDRATPGLNVPPGEGGGASAAADGGTATGGATQQEFADCLTNAGQGLPVALTPGGLPDFTTFDFAFSTEQFQTIVECVPGLGQDLTATPLAADVRARAQAVAERVRGSVVYIETTSGGGGGTGAGFLISDDGLILTNEHVVADAATIAVWLLDGRRFEARRVGGEVIPDIAVLRIAPPTGVAPLQIGAAAGLAHGDTLVAIGHPDGAGNWVATAGGFLRFDNTTITHVATGTEAEATNLIAAVPTKEGNSGGPILDLDGRVVGVVSGGSLRNPIIVGQGKPVVGPADVREFVVPTTIMSAVPIEHALQVAAAATGDTSLTRGADPRFPDSVLPTELTPETEACVAGAIGALAGSFHLTGKGMPDFSAMGDATMTTEQFEALIACLPGLSLIPSPLLLAEESLEPAFPAQVRSQAQALGERVRPSVVYLELGTGILATGFFISDDGLILTNRHNVTNSPNRDAITAWLLDGRSYEVEVVGVAEDGGPDIALLKIEAPAGVTPLAIGSSVGLSREQPLVVVGHPGAMGNWAVTLGAFQRMDESLGGPGARPLSDLVTTTPTLGGNSGSPVLDLEGRVVGVIHGGKDREQRHFGVEPPEAAAPTVLEFLSASATSFALAVPIEDAMSLVAEWTP